MKPVPPVSITFIRHKRCSSRPHRYNERAVRTRNRVRLLMAWLLRRPNVQALPVEYIVETTAKCNLYCPMCPREEFPQPKEDMLPAVFDRLLAETGSTAENMMLIGLGEPFLDPLIYDRIRLCKQHGVATLLSTNGTLLDEKATERLLDTPLNHLTMSFDGATKETFEHYRKGAKFERVRDNFLHFARRKAERRSSLQAVVQLVMMERNETERNDFQQFWAAQPGVDSIRLKADETAVLHPEGGHAPDDWKHPCHYLWRGAMYVKHNGDVYPCCQSYALGGQALGNVATQSMPEIFNGTAMQEMRRLHIDGQASQIDICRKCRTAIPHPVMVAGSLLLSGSMVRRLLPLVERLAHRFGRLGRWLQPSARQINNAEKLVQIEQITKK
jgi:radical SAM protein with 4Fe4S-binding SPASM domain